MQIFPSNAGIDFINFAQNTHHHENHSHDNGDKHIWLSTSNAKQIATNLYKALSTLNPQKDYSKAYEALIIEIKNTDKRPAKDPGKSAEKEKDTEIRQGSESLKTIPKDPGKEEPLAAGEKAAQAPPLQDNPGEEKRERDPDKRIPKALRDLMIAGDVDEWDIQNVVNARQPGVFPFDMPVKDYPQDFVNEWIIPNWGRILEYIADMKEKEEIPF